MRMTNEQHEGYSACKWALRLHKEGNYILCDELLEIVLRNINKYDGETNRGYDERVQRKGKGSIKMSSGSMSSDPIVRKGFRRK